jgi:hypothetical protein
VHLNRKLFPAAIFVFLLVFVALTESQMTLAPPITPSHVFVAPPKEIPYDNETPIISVSSPINSTYDSGSVFLNFTITKPHSWNNDTITFANVTEYFGQIDEVTYNLDGQWIEANMTTPDNWSSKSPIFISVNLTGLENGPHYVCINASGWCLFAPTFFAYRFANHLVGNSSTLYFTVNIAPKISILSPENKVYNETSTPLTFTTDKPVSSIWYSLDGGPNVTISGNTTLTQLTDEQHSLHVYAQVPTGNIGASELPVFTVDLPPNITLLTPVERPYNTTAIPVNFNTDKPVSWIAYSLDGQNNVVINGNTTLSDLPDGNHTLTIYAADAFGNEGQSQTISFTRYPIMAPAPPSSTLITIEHDAAFLAGTALAIVVCIILCLFVLRRRRQRQALNEIAVPLNNQV